MNYFASGHWWLPDGDDEHLRNWLTGVNDRVAGRLTYQRKKYLHALSYVDERLYAVDVGAHVGLWSWMMARDFRKVVAFEPVAEHVACWRKNMVDCVNASVIKCALGAENYGFVMMERSEFTSMKMAVGVGGERVRLRTLDSFVIRRIDLLKIDCEGYELRVLQGATAMLQRHRPVVVVEQKKMTDDPDRYGTKTGDAVRLLEKMGAAVREEIRGDYILTWPR